MPWSTSTRRSQLPADWAVIRRRVLRRDNHQCRATVNNTRCNHPATDVDHTNDPTDHRDTALQSLCPTHHKQKTAAEGHAAMRARRRTAHHPQEPHPGLS